MNSTVALLAVHAALIAVRPGPQTDCPSSRQVSEAMAARIPGVLFPADAPRSADVLTLVLGRDLGGPTVSLIDGGGRLRLRRMLTPSAGPPDRDCPALAETVALIVERYTNEVEGAPPPSATAVATTSPPASPTGMDRGELYLGTAWRPRSDGGPAVEAVAGGGVALGAARRWTLMMMATLGGAMNHDWAAGEGELRRYGGRAGLGWRSPLGWIRLELGGLAGVDALTLDARAGRRTRTDLRISPVLEGVVGVRFPLGRRAFARVVGVAGAALLRYEYVATVARRQEVAFETHRVYGKLAVEVGFSF